MNMMESILLAVLLLVGVLLIVVILMQNGKGANSGVALGSGGGGSMGSPDSNTVLVKVTTCLAILFFSITLGLAYVANKKAEQSRTILQDLVESVDEKSTAIIPLKENLPTSEPSDLEATKRIAGGDKTE